VVVWLLSFGASAATLTGTIRGADGNPLPQTEVLAINMRLQAIRTNTSADGRFSFPLLPEGRYRVWAAPQSDDPHTPRYYPDAVGYCEGDTLSLGSTPLDIELMLPLGEQIWGTLLDSDSTPIVGARVRANSESGAGTRESWTDTEGLFQIMGLEPSQQWQLQAAVSGWPIQWWEGQYDDENAAWISADGNPTLPAWTLLDGVIVEGQVLGPDGPVPAPTVRGYGSGQLVQTTGNSAGHYSIAGLPPGDILTWATADGFANTYLPDHDRPTEVVEVPNEGDLASEINIEMPWEATVQITLEGNAPRTNGDLSGLTVTLYNDTHTVGRGDQTDDLGEVVLYGLHGGTYEIFVYGGDAGHPDDWLRNETGELVTISLESEQDNGPYTFELPPASTLEGDVVDDYGTPIPGAALVLTTPKAELTEDDPGAVLITTADKDGYFSLVGIPDGNWDAKVQFSPYCESDPGFVASYWRGEIDPLMASSIHIDPSQPVQNIQFTMPRDDDHDDMGDRWERRYNLDLNRNDAFEDPDDDGLPNLYEYRMRTDPHQAEGYWVTETSCGCASAPPKNSLWWLLVGLFAIRRRDVIVPRKSALPVD
jgi:MYXO-CTERM domain-containing protein